MALFQKKPIVENMMPLYTLSSSQTYLIVGLGNPGATYDDTRHNIGFAVLDTFADSNGFPGWVQKKDLEGLVTVATLGQSRVVLLKPTTFMNESGRAVQKTSHFYKVPTGNIIVVHDELDIDYGQIRSRSGGSAAGHNGVKSAIAQLGEDGFGRIRIGIGPKSPPQIDAADFVLQKFSGAEQGTMKALLSEATAMLNDYVFASGGTLPAETRSFLV